MERTSPELYGEIRDYMRNLWGTNQNMNEEDLGFELPYEPTFNEFVEKYRAETKKKVGKQFIDYVNSDCPICFLNPLTDQESNYILKILEYPENLGTYFTRSVADRWLEIKSSCPMCRSRKEFGSKKRRFKSRKGHNKMNKRRSKKHKRYSKVTKRRTSKRKKSHRKSKKRKSKNKKR